MDEPKPQTPAIHSNPHAPVDGMLVRRVLQGDKQAFNELVVRYQKTAFAVSYRLLGQTDDAQEVVQDAFLKAYRSLDSLQKPEAFAGWLMRIVSNLSLNYRRGRKTRQALPLDDAFETDPTDGPVSEDRINPQRVAEGHQLGQKLEQALEQLPEKQKLAILMFTIEGLPQKQVAEALQCSVEAVKWHVFQGRKRLRELLKDVL